MNPEQPASQASTALQPIYGQLEKAVLAGDRQQGVEQLIEHLQQQGLYHELFEALKMRMRLRLGLPAAQADRQEKFDEATELELERGLIEACRTVGELFMRQGKIREGWMYLRPVGDREVAAAALAGVEATDENVDQLLEVLLHEGVDIARGFRLVLERLGTCNSITMFESTLAARPRADQQIAARLLVEHVHRELSENLRRDIAKREGSEPTEATIDELLQSRSDLLRDGSYHLDTSHIGSTVRFARVLDDAEPLRLALDLAHYGRRLHPQYQYPGEEPFLDLYPASVAFYQALLGEQVDSGIRYFTRKADAVDQQQYGTVAMEVLIDLLSRCGRHAEALQAYAKRIPVGARIIGIAPTLLQLSQRLGEYEPMLDICKQRDDLLGYAAAILQE
ncbi:MAG: hypothetical protein IT422_06185 [Pirellulaceae bacterium]|nr:hypothetical protein [Pirellulaceae bacterium]